MTRRAGICLAAMLLAGVVALVAWGTSRWHQQDQLALDYTITIDPEELEYPQVHLRVRHLGAAAADRGPLVLGTRVQDNYRAPHRVWVDGGESEEFTEERRFLGENWAFTRHRIHYRGDGFDVRYRARVGVKEGKDTKGFTGIRLGMAEPDLFVALGHSLFLYPVVEPHRVAAVSLRIENRTGHPLHTPWIEREGALHPTSRGELGLRELLASTVLVGPSSRQRVEIGDPGQRTLELEIVLSDRVAPETRDALAAGVTRHRPRWIAWWCMSCRETGRATISSLPAGVTR